MRHKNYRTRFCAALLLVMAPLMSLSFPLPERPTREYATVEQPAVFIGTKDSVDLPSVPAVGTRRAAGMIVSQVDHVLLATPDNGRTLVSLLTDRLALPIVWPQPGSEWKASTGISLGNVNLEIFHREPPSPGQPPRIPRISSLALQPTNLEIALKELRLRGIAHDPPPEPKSGPAHEPLPRWTTVGLKGFGHGLFLIQYAFDMDERRLRFERVLREGNGGPLGVVRVREVVIAPDRLGDVRAQWTKLLGPADTSGADLWSVGEGPRIRLVSAGDPRTGNIVVEVQSLKRAAKALRRLGIRANTTDRQIRMDPEALSGLRLVLQEPHHPFGSRQ